MFLSKEILLQIIDELKTQGKKIVFTNGCFDIIHAGHLDYLTKAKQLGDYLIIGLNSDDSVSKLKGPSRPINNQEDRAAVLSGLKPVDFVVLFEEQTPFNLINSIKPDILVKGGDYTIENIVGSDIVENNGGKVIVIPFVKGKSTTNIIEKIKEN